MPAIPLIRLMAMLPKGRNTASPSPGPPPAPPGMAYKLDEYGNFMMDEDGNFILVALD